MLAAVLIGRLISLIDGRHILRLGVHVPCVPGIQHTVQFVSSTCVSVLHSAPRGVEHVVHCVYAFMVVIHYYYYYTVPLSTGFTV